jgi:flagellin-like hook-associated protein FlgL
MYLCKYKSVESFTEDSFVAASLYETNGLTSLNEEEHDLQFDSPFHLIANKVDISGKSLFQKDIKFEDTQDINFGKDGVINSEHSIYFQDNSYSAEDEKLSKADLMTIKKNKSKIDYIKTEGEGVIRMKEGDFQGTHSAKTTGNEACTSKLWDIAIGKPVSKKDLCKACCKNVDNKADFKAFLTFQNGNTKIHQLVYVNLFSNRNMCSLVELKTVASKPYSLTATLFKNNPSYECELYFILETDQTKLNEIRGKVELDDIKAATVGKYIKTIFSTDQDIEWGAISKGIDIATTIHESDVQANMVLLAVVPKSSGS